MLSHHTPCEFALEFLGRMISIEPDIDDLCVYFAIVASRNRSTSVAAVNVVVPVPVLVLVPVLVPVLVSVCVVYAIATSYRRKKKKKRRRLSLCSRCCSRSSCREHAGPKSWSTDHRSRVSAVAHRALGEDGE